MPTNKQAYLVSLEAIGCLPDSQFPAYGWADAVETARSLFENEFEGADGWTWAVNNDLTAKEVIEAAPWGCVFAEETRDTGLYRVVITAVDEETAKEWEDD